MYYIVFLFSSGGELEDDDNDNNDLMSVYGGTPTQKMVCMNVKVDR